MALYPRERPAAVYFLQWLRRGDKVDGTLSVVYPTTLDTPTSTQHVEGELDDDRRLRLDVGDDPARRWEGERVGRSIVFRVELEDAAEQTITFRPSTLAAYRRTVERIRAGG